MRREVPSSGGSSAGRRSARRIRWCGSLIALASVTLAACAADAAGSGSMESSAPGRELLEPRLGLYAEASRYGDLVWTAGHLPEGVPVSAPIEEQVTQVLDNLESTLEDAGAGFDTVVKANVFLTSFDDWDAFNTAFFERMTEYGLPPRSTVAVSELGWGYRVEIEMVAVLRDASD